MGQSASTLDSTPQTCPIQSNAIQANPVQDNAIQATQANATNAITGCPVDHSRSQCPVNDDSSVNPLNQIPTLSQSPSPHQHGLLPTSRTESSIPRTAAGKWVYPSPQQFYNALARKGWETPEEHVETMVDIHNFLNEQAWEEVLQWERRHDASVFSNDI